MRRCGRVIGFGVNFAVQRGDQRIYDAAMRTARACRAASANASARRSASIPPTASAASAKRSAPSCSISSRHPALRASPMPRTARASAPWRARRKRCGRDAMQIGFQFATASAQALDGIEQWFRPCSSFGGSVSRVRACSCRARRGAAKSRALAIVRCRLPCRCPHLLQLLQPLEFGCQLCREVRCAQ